MPTIRDAYRNRADAGKVLAGELRDRLAAPCVVAAIPSGGALVAAPIAARFGWPLTLTFSRKLTLPEAPETAFGALDEDGHALVDYPRFHDLSGRPGDLSRARERVGREVQSQQARFPVTRIDAFLPGSTVLLVDDGLATGDTMRAAIAHARRHGARRIVVAVPCASVEAAEAIRRDVDDFVCPWVDEGFIAVGTHYDDFDRVADEEVLRVLDEAKARSGNAGAR